MFRAFYAVSATVFSTVDSIEKANRVIRRCEMLVERSG